MQTAKTGKIGDGKVFVLSVDEAYRIRTEESNEKGRLGFSCFPYKKRAGLRTRPFSLSPRGWGG